MGMSGCMGQAVIKLVALGERSGHAFGEGCSWSTMVTV